MTVRDGQPPSSNATRRQVRPIVAHRQGRGRLWRVHGSHTVAVTATAPELATDTAHYGAGMAELGDELGMLASKQSQWLTHRPMPVWDRCARLTSNKTANETLQPTNIPATSRDQGDES